MVTANGCDLNRQKDSGKYDIIYDIIDIQCVSNFK
jgi:hypothetical protein